MKFTPELTDAAIARILGERIDRYRIEAGLTQAELAERAGIGKRTVERIEAGHGAELVTLIRVLRTLNALEGLENSCQSCRSARSSNSSFEESNASGFRTLAAGAKHPSVPTM